ncbi:monocarboxylate transporter 9-like [Acanthaster planci]|uniref:Monocarboxylate transporter 9-like n=1 Tax=Acanthaster planci TaxID=133434 RepID=A0A8B7YEB6_ACAPL|nr:monocarboxylate transporter 9-like [Acanthaster planci]
MRRCRRFAWPVLYVKAAVKIRSHATIAVTQTTKWHWNDCGKLSSLPLFASIISRYIAGILYNYNVLFVYFEEEFQKGALYTGWVGSLAATLYCVASPLAVVLGSRLGNTRLALVGTLLQAVSYLSTSFISSLDYGFLTFGLLVGLGCNFAYCAAGSALLGCVSSHGKNRCRATGIALTFCSVGKILPSLFRPCLSEAHRSTKKGGCDRPCAHSVLLCRKQTNAFAKNQRCSLPITSLHPFYKAKLGFSVYRDDHFDDFRPAGLPNI